MKNAALVKVHLGCLDGLRAVAALYVAGFHALCFPGGAVAPPIHSGLLQKLYSYFCTLMFQGHSAVVVFIMLSGFCLMLPITRGNGELRGGALHFFKKRTRRILPPYFAAVGLSLLLIYTLIGQQTGTMWDTAVPVSYGDIITRILLLQDLFPFTQGRINPVLWSISVEWRIYFLFPFFVWAWKKWGAARVVVPAVALSLLLQFALKFTPINTDQSATCAHFVGVFTLGMLACEVSFSKDRYGVLRERIPWGTIGLVLLVLVFAILRVLPGLPFYIRDMVVAAGAFSLLVSLSLSTKGAVYRLLSWKPLVFMGTFSYSIYLMHVPFLQVIHQYVLSPLHLGYYATMFASFGLALPPSVLATYAFHRAFEKPFMGAKKIVEAVPTV